MARTVTQETPDTIVTCAHCGLPVPPRLQDQSPAFCCSSCRTVHGILRDAGLDRTYYRLRESSPPTRSTPPSLSTAASVLDELDSPDFLEAHALRTDGGLYRTHLFLDGVHCAACVWLVERLPFHVDGVESARLNLPRARLTVEWNPDTVRLSEVASWLARFGYPVLPRIDGHNAPESGEERRLLIRMGVAWALQATSCSLRSRCIQGWPKIAGPCLRPHDG